MVRRFQLISLGKGILSVSPALFRAPLAPLAITMPEYPTVTLSSRRALGGLLVLGYCLLLMAGFSVHGEETVAISTKASKDYVRKKLPSGAYQVETYAFGEGDNWSGARVDATIDKMGFMDVERVVAAPLAKQNYLPTRDQKTTNLLVMVYWGTTRAPEHAADSPTFDLVHAADRKIDSAHLMMKTAGSASAFKEAQLEAYAADAEMRAALAMVNSENQRREDTDVRTVALLGYDSWWMATESAAGGGERAFRKKDMLDEVEEDRYFVVLMAYDFQAMVKKKKKLLWEAHISIREHSNQFDKRLPDMMEQAAAFLGQNSNGLQHTDLPQGTVIVGPLQSLGTVTGK
jgi:hypothetical protein